MENTHTKGKPKHPTQASSLEGRMGKKIGKGGEISLPPQGGYIPPPGGGQTRPASPERDDDER